MDSNQLASRSSGVNLKMDGTQLLTLLRPLFVLLRKVTQRQDSRWLSCWTWSNCCWLQSQVIFITICILTKMLYMQNRFFGNSWLNSCKKHIFSGWPWVIGSLHQIKPESWHSSFSSTVFGKMLPLQSWLYPPEQHHHFHLHGLPSAQGL